jgi:hypothetical protein
VVAARLSAAAGPRLAAESAARSRLRRRVSKGMFIEASFLIDGGRSAPLEFGSHEQQGERLRPVGGAFDLQPRGLGQARPEAA